MSETNTEPTVTESELKKSVEALMALLDADAPTDEAVENALAKSMEGTEGGLAHMAGAPPLNPELTMPGVEYSLLGAEEQDPDELLHEMIGSQMKMNPVENKPMKKSEAAEPATEMPSLEEDEAEQEAFAKSLAEAFAQQDALTEAAASSEFAKSLVLGTIEGLSIAHEEFAKGLAEMEARHDAKISVLAKSLAAIATAVGEIKREVVAVSNAPARPMAKSVQNVHVLEKSFGGQAGDENPALLKSRVVSALEKRVADGKLDAFQLVRYETTGVLDPALAKDIQSELGL